MALINCVECHSEVSSNAPACPKCGNPLSKTKGKESVDKGHGFFYYLAWVIATPFILFFGAVVLSVISDSGKPEKPKSDAEYLNSAIEHQAELCKDGHTEACDTERSMARLKQSAGY